MLFVQLKMNGTITIAETQNDRYELRYRESLWRYQPSSGALTRGGPIFQMNFTNAVRFVVTVEHQELNVMTIRVTAWLTMQFIADLNGLFTARPNYCLQFMGSSALDLSPLNPNNIFALEINVNNTVVLPPGLYNLDLVQYPAPWVPPAITMHMARLILRGHGSLAILQGLNFNLDYLHIDLMPADVLAEGALPVLRSLSIDRFDPNATQWPAPPSLQILKLGAVSPARERISLPALSELRACPTDVFTTIINASNITLLDIKWPAGDATAIPAEFFTRQPALQILHLRGLPTAAIPATFTGLPELLELYIYNAAQLTTLPTLPATLYSLCMRNCRQLQYVPRQVLSFRFVDLYGCGDATRNPQFLAFSNIFPTWKSVRIRVDTQLLALILAVGRRRMHFAHPRLPGHLVRYMYDLFLAPDWHEFHDIIR